MNGFSQELLLLILIGVVANGNDVDLANNTSILLILALVLFNGANNGSCGCECGCNNGGCCRGNALFSI